MGGFSVYDDNNEPHTITLRELGELLKNGEIKITEEIRSKGKGDALLKAAILIQTTSFVLQCIAPKVEGLPIGSGVGEGGVKYAICLLKPRIDAICCSRSIPTFLPSAQSTALIFISCAMTYI